MIKSQGAKRFRAKLKKIGMKQKDFARLLHKNKQTINRWATGKTDVPETTWIILESLGQKR